MNYPVYEHFNAFQGEGDHMGRHAFFIRTFGCPVKCDFCDSAGTWHPKLRPEKVNRYDANELAELATLSGAHICIVTGGEPIIHDLSELGAALRKRGIRFHIETSGALPKAGNYLPDWITLSPKWAKLPCDEWLSLANEIKIVATSAEDLESWLNWLSRKLPASLHGKSLWIHPEWSCREDAKLLEAICDAVKYPSSVQVADTGYVARAGYQLHKLYNVDALDPNAKPVLPFPKDLK